MTKTRKARADTAAPKLTAKQRLFVDEYLVDLNATQAAIRAGYSANSAASIGEENLRKPEIMAAIDAAMDARAARTQITQDRVVEELAAIGFSRITDAVSWKTYDLADIQKKDVRPTAEWEEDGEDGVGEAIPIGLFFTDVNFKDSAELPDNMKRAIASITKDQGGKLKIAMHDKKGALVSLLRHTGGFDQKATLKQGSGGSVIVEIQRFGK